MHGYLHKHLLQLFYFVSGHLVDTILGDLMPESSVYQRGGRTKCRATENGNNVVVFVFFCEIIYALLFCFILFLFHSPESGVRGKRKQSGFFNMRARRKKSWFLDR